MKKTGLLIFTNHIFPWHVGGSEIVVDKIASEIAKHRDVIVCGGDIPSDQEYKNYSHKKITNTIDLFETLSKFSSYKIFIYSDGYLFSRHIFNWAKRRDREIFLAPVGFNICREKKAILDMVVENPKISFIYHDSNYVDYELGKNLLHINNRRHCIIPNGYDPEEFSSIEKSDLVDKKIITTVANTFPFKGHDLCIHVLDELSKTEKFEYHIFCTTPSWVVAKMKLKWLLEKSSKREWMHVHVDSRREKMIKYLSASKCMLFLSQKEVSPLVLIESCAAKIPWVSFDVGNANSIPGGFIVEAQADGNGNKIMSTEVCDSVKIVIMSILNSGKNTNTDTDIIDDFLNKRSWSNISRSYDEFFFQNK